MARSKILKAFLGSTACMLFIARAAHAEQFDIPAGDLAAALDAYTAQTGVSLMVSSEAVRGSRTRGAKGELSASAALSQILSGTGFIERHEANGVAIVRDVPQSHAVAVTHLAEAEPVQAASSVETVVVTSSKIKGDIQTVPIAITALSQEQLTSRQIAGGPDLVKEVPNLTFTKTNFAGYSIQIRGIGTQAISVTTDPAVAVALNDTPFIRNHFFEQEFFDVNQVEVLRGPQGTLYGRNATAGVVNIVSAKPTDQFEAMLSADWGNYNNRRYEGMVNFPIVDDRLDLRVAGEWTKRDGYSFNQTTDSPIDGRDLWSSRVTIGWKPASKIQTYLIWEHFQEDDDRLRSSKQLCKTSPTPTEIGGVPISSLRLAGNNGGNTTGGIFSQGVDGLSQGCLPASLYSPESFEVPNGYPLPYVLALDGDVDFWNTKVDPYASTTQSRNLRDIQSQLDPIYKAKNDTIELNADYQITPALTVTSETGYNQDFLWSTEDYNRFDTSPDLFSVNPRDTLSGDQRGQIVFDGNYSCPDGTLSIGSNNCSALRQTGYFCDPQLGCSNRLVAEDLSDENSWQFSQELRLASDFKGPLNFSIGGNYLHYDTEENYYVFFNSITLFASVGPVENTRITTPWVQGVSDNHECLQQDYAGGYQYHSTTASGISNCSYIDPNPLSKLNNEGHNYFLSQNPYSLNSYAGFGEVYYNVLKDLKLTGGLRWTEDQKHFVIIPSELLTEGYGYPIAGATDQKWDKLTGRFNIDWSPKLSFTDQTLLYTSYAHGYKAGGANPPGAILLVSAQFQPTHPLTFKPEFVDAYELGTKNTMLDGGLTLNGDVFFYNYKGYQISEIVDRTSINLNFDATVKGAELEAAYEPIPGLKFNFAGGYEDTRIDNGQSAVDLMDRTAGHSDWMVIRPQLTDASNCILPVYVVQITGAGGGPPAGESFCDIAYIDHKDPATGNSYTTTPPPPGTFDYYPADYTGFDPLAGTSGDPYTGQNIYKGHDYGPVPNNGDGFSKNLGGNQLPNAPHFTTSFSADYTMPVSEDWAATLHGDFYWQSQSWWRVFNDMNYDKLRGYSNVNLAVTLTSASGWQVMGYLKNVFDTTAITGAFLNSDDSGLTTNVFLTDPRLFGVRVTKNW